VVVVNEAAARALWPGQDPIGKPVSVGQGGFWNDTARVVGVVGDVRYGTLETPAAPAAYLSFYQSPRGRMMLYLRAAGDPIALAPAARRAIHDLAPDLPVYDIKSMAVRVADATSYARFSALLLALFAAIALALATLGVYGVVSFAVSQRTRELGIRVALGATRRDVMRLVVGHGVALAVVGGAFGLAAALAATRVLRSLLYGVEPSDPATFLGVAALLAAAAVVASWIPARRAARVDPAGVLKAG
jgi:predicted lysophospholipase L1 biosynthesis ABC-type transport system permease subunit